MPPEGLGKACRRRGCSSYTQEALGCGWQGGGRSGSRWGKAVAGESLACLAGSGAHTEGVGRVGPMADMSVENWAEATSLKRLSCP